MRGDGRISLNIGLQYTYLSVSTACGRGKWGMKTTLAHPLLRSAERRDLPAIVGLIRELAEFERLAHLVVVTPESLEPHLFGARPAAVRRKQTFPARAKC